MQHTNYSVTIYFHVTTHLFLTQVKTYWLNLKLYIYIAFSI
jgi:hypothetical protein